MSLVRWLAIAVVLVACARPVAAPVATPAPAPVASTPVAAPVAATTLVFIDKVGIRLGEPRVLVPLPADASQGADARYKRHGPNDLYLVPLGEALADEKAKARIRLPLPVVVDESTPYRVLIEVLFTAGQIEIGEYTLHEQTLDGRSFPFHAPRSHLELSGSGPVKATLGVSVLVVSEGISIKTSGGNIAPGCGDTGPGLAVPRREGRLDLQSLASCLGKLKAADPAFVSETDATLVANPNVPFRELMDVALTIRGAREELFPVIRLGVAR